MNPLMETIAGPTQHGFIPKRSIFNIDYILHAFQAKAPKKCAAVLLDVKGAYDSVPHNMLLDILQHSNVPIGIQRLTRRL